MGLSSRACLQRSSSMPQRNETSGFDDQSHEMGEGTCRSSDSGDRIRKLRLADMNSSPRPSNTTPLSLSPSISHASLYKYDHCLGSVDTKGRSSGAEDMIFRKEESRALYCPPGRQEAARQRCRPHPSTTRSSALSQLLLIFISSLVIVSLLSSQVICARSSCKFPQRWHGQWLQKGFRDPISINADQISEKGRCKGKSGEKYLLAKRDTDSSDCYRCLFISEKHPNVLQYKETDECIRVESKRRPDLEAICGQIAGDAPLKSLFRRNTQSVKCPFNGTHYTFAYSRSNSGVFCNQPPSTMDECITTDRIRLKFQSCVDMAWSENKREDLQCVADWKEGSTRWMVGRISSDSHSYVRTEVDAYRCFVFKGDENTGDYNLSQSSDSGCGDAFTPDEGWKIFKMRPAFRTSITCRWPDYLQGRTFTTLNGNEQYQFTENELFIYNMTTMAMYAAGYGPSQMGVGGAMAPAPPLLGARDVRLIRRVTCAQSDFHSYNYSQYSTFSVHDCESGYQCLKIHRRTHHVVELLQSRFSSLSMDNLCPLNALDRVILIGDRIDESDCPFSGQYRPADFLQAYYSQVFGCADGSESQIVSQCRSRSLLESHCSNTQTTPISFKCHESWSEDDIHFALVQSPASRGTQCVTVVEKRIPPLPNNQPSANSVAVPVPGESDELYLWLSDEHCVRPPIINPHDKSLSAVTGSHSPSGDPLAFMRLLRTGGCMNSGGSGRGASTLAYHHITQIGLVVVISLIVACVHFRRERARVPNPMVAHHPHHALDPQIML